MMKVYHRIVILSALSIPIVATVHTGSRQYTWLQEYSERDAIVNRVPTPPGYERVKVAPASFQDWLRRLPLRGGRPPVYLFNGKKKLNQTAHWAVIDIDVGSKDLQQCADAVIRLRAEYLFSTGVHDTIRFNFTSGDKAEFSKWAEGYRPKVAGRKVEWDRSAPPDSSYATFSKYLETVFTYAGSYSLSREMMNVEGVHDMQIGDAFIEPGFPGHAAIVVDLARSQSGGRKVFLLAQSYMPAQDIHILKNPEKPDLDPWYDMDFGEKLVTPEWTFDADNLRRFREK